MDLNYVVHADWALSKSLRNAILSQYSDFRV